MRHEYLLSDETRKVLTSHVGRIAEEMDVTDKYLYAILAGDKTDFFAAFVCLYAAASRAGAPVCHWRLKLDAIDARYGKPLPAKTEIQCLTDKINLNANSTAQLVDALSDGVIDDSEAGRLQQAIDKERSNLDLLESRVQLRRDLRAVARR